MINISDLQCGKAGEYLVCADLILKGYVAFPSEQGLPFDVVVDVNGKLAKVQVKTTRTYKPLPHSKKTHLTGYLFNVARMGKGGMGTYSIGDVDIFALVALDTRTIGYIALQDIKSSMQFRVEAFRGEYLGEKLIERNERIKELRNGGMEYRDIGIEMSVDPAYAWRVVHGKEERERGRYLSEFDFDSAVRRAGFLQ